MTCRICNGIGDLKKYDNYEYMKDELPHKHGGCILMDQDPPGMLEAAQQMNTLEIPGVHCPYSLVTLPIKGDDNDDLIIENAKRSLLTNMRNSYGEMAFFEKELTKVSIPVTKSIVMDAFFYGYYKYVCINSRTRENPNSRDIEKPYGEAVKKVYAALFGNDSASLQALCLEVVREKVEKSKQDSSKAGNDVAEASGSTAGPPIPKIFQEEIEGVVCYHARDMMNDMDDGSLDSDELLIIINRPKGMAVAMFCFYSRYYG